jgi:hypothetical protein
MGCGDWREAGEREPKRPGGRRLERDWRTCRRRRRLLLDVMMLVSSERDEAVLTSRQRTSPGATRRRLLHVSSISLGRRPVTPTDPRQSGNLFGLGALAALLTDDPDAVHDEGRKGDNGWEEEEKKQERGQLPLYRTVSKRIVIPGARNEGTAPVPDLIFTDNDLEAVVVGVVRSARAGGAGHRVLGLLLPIAPEQVLIRFERDKGRRDVDIRRVTCHTISTWLFDTRRRSSVHTSSPHPD